MGAQMDYQLFKDIFLVENFKDKLGRPKHTRLVKHLFYKFANELKQEFEFDLHTCSECGCNDWHNGRPFMMELDHINRNVSDARISNLRVLCPICHTQTNGYKNRSLSIEEYWSKVWKQSQEASRDNV